VLKKNDPSRHGEDSKARENNLVTTWKKRHNVKMYFNCYNSLDLASIETCWSLPKRFQRKGPHWDKQTLKKLLEKRWTHVTQD